MIEHDPSYAWALGPDHPYPAPEPLGLQDKDWLVCATGRRRYAVEWPFIDKLNRLQETGLVASREAQPSKTDIVLARYAGQLFIEELGWNDMPEVYTKLTETAPPQSQEVGSPLPPPDYISCNMRTLYSYTGKRVMDVVTNDAAILRTNPLGLFLLTQELEHAMAFDVVGLLLEDTHLFTSKDDPDTKLRRLTIAGSAAKHIDLINGESPTARFPKPRGHRALAMKKMRELLLDQYMPRPAAIREPRIKEKARKPSKQATTLVVRAELRSEAFQKIVTKDMLGPLQEIPEFVAALAAATPSRRLNIDVLSFGVNCASHQLLKICPRLLVCSDEVFTKIMDAVYARKDIKTLSSQGIKSMIDQIEKECDN